VLRSFFLVAAVAFVRATAWADQVSTIAGNGIQGFSGDGGPALAASLNTPTDVVVAPDGTIYFADAANFRVRRIRPDGIIDTVAGNGLPGDPGEGGTGGVATSASIYVQVIALDAPRNLLYIGDSFNHALHRVDLTTGIISYVAQVLAPQGIAIDPAGDIYASETPNCTIVKISATTGVVSRVAGLPPPDGCDGSGDGGPADLAEFFLPTVLALDGAGNLFIVEPASDPLSSIQSSRVRRIDAVTGIVTTVAGGGATLPGAGPATAMDLGVVQSIATDRAAGTAATRLFITNARRIFVVDLTTGQLSVLAGSCCLDGYLDGPAADALFFGPRGVAVAPGGAVVVAEANNHRLRLITPVSTGVSFIGTGLTTIVLDGVTAINGDLVIAGNPNLTTVNLGPVESIGGNLTIINNPALTSIDLGNVQHIDGNLTIIDNGTGHVELGGVQSIGGNLTVTSTGVGTDVYSVAACPGGDGSTDIDLAGYARLTATAPPNGGTTITMEDGSVLTVALEPGSFDTCVPFSIAASASLPPGTDINLDNETVHMDFVVSYEISFEVPVIGLPASLTFDIDLASLGAGRAEDVLRAYNAGLLTVATINTDLGGRNTQVFPVCASGQEPSAGGCVSVVGLDANGNPTAGTPAVIRLSGLVGHFSTWGVVTLTPVPASTASFNGLLQPYREPPQTTTPTFKAGAVVPVKFNWLDASGAVTDSATANPQLAIYAGACTADAPTTEPLAVDDAGQSGGLRYDAATRTWIFGWATKGLAAGCYSIEIVPGASGFAAPGRVFPLALKER
jgi:sugar lactone lactonase YvrE